MSLTLDQEDHLMGILGNGSYGKLTEWENNFLASVASDYEIKGVDIWISPKMWVILERIESKQKR